MQNTSGISRRTILKGISAVPLAAALGPVRAQNRAKVIVIGAGLSGLNAALLLEEQGLAVEAFARLYARRNDRPVYLAE